jgi:hypothetical protein
LLSAQYPFPDIKHAQLALDRTLAIQLLPEETEVEAAMNQAIRETFTAHWQLGSIQFFSPKEFSKKIKQRSNEFVFLGQGERLSEDLRLQMKYVDGSFESWVSGTTNDPEPLDIQEVEQFNFDMIRLSYYDFELSLFDGRSEKILTHISYVNDELAKHDYLFLCQQLQLLINASVNGIMRADFMDVAENIRKVKDNTNVLLKDYFSSDEQNIIPGFFDAPYEIQHFKLYTDTILQLKKDSNYIKLIFSYMHNKYMWILVNAADGQIISVNEISDYKFAGTYPAQNLIKARYLKDATDENQQLLNNYYNK